MDESLFAKQKAPLSREKRAGVSSHSHTKKQGRQLALPFREIKIYDYRVAPLISA